ncbi:MAG TPA: hypothetical protein VJZ00_05720 [Thermoanaerobaculia bacterium]|nr:hypothetical protein [Thermoanaerobaculia bacterium]
MSDAQRTLIGRSTSLTGREAIWRIPDGLEIQSKENYEVVRRRVLFEDIVFVTHHREAGGAYLVATGLIALLFLTLAISIISGAGFGAWPAALVFALIGLPALIGFSLRLMFRLDVITVYGKRTKASIRFGMRKQRARDTYAQIVAAVRAAQNHRAREIAREEAAAEPEVIPVEEAPPMPPDSEFL